MVQRRTVRAKQGRHAASGKPDAVRSMIREDGAGPYEARAEHPQASAMARDGAGLPPLPLEQQIAERTAELRQVAAALAEAEERERRALAQDLHDEVGQLLAVIGIKLAGCEPLRMNAKVRAAVEEVARLVEQANASLRSLSFHLAPPVLYELGLTAALEWLADEMRRQFGLKVNIVDDGLPKPLHLPARAIAFRAVRELLINVTRHAGVDVAEIVTLRREPDELVITVSDAGKGFDYSQHRTIAQARRSGGFGLIGLHERLAHIGARMHVESIPGDGARITLTIPMQLA